MSSKITEATWRDYIEAAAQKAVESKDKQYHFITKGSHLDDDAKNKLFNDYKDKLSKEYPYGKITQKELDAIDMYDADSMRMWLEQYGISNRVALSPTEYKAKATAAKILPLLQGVAPKGRDWHTMPKDDLKEEGMKMGFDVSTKEGYGEFLKAIGEQQVNYDRAKLQQEAKEEMGWTYWPRRVIAPSAMQEFENALATGGDYDASTAAKFGALDAGANSAMFLAPGFNVVKNPIMNGIIDAGIQAGVEAGRQGAKQGLSTTGQEFDIAPVVFAGGAGATKPVIIGTAQGAVSRIPGEGPAQVARGISKAVKTGDPVYTERTGLEKAIDAYNKEVASKSSTQQILNQMFNEGVQKFNTPEIQQALKQLYESAVTRGDEESAKKLLFLINAAGKEVKIPYVDVVPLQQVEKGIAVSSVPEKAKFFGIEPNADNTYDAAKILSMYDKPLDAYRQIDDGVVSFGKNIGLRTDPTRYVLDKETRDTYRRLFPAKYTDESTQTGYSKAGRIAGNILAGIGSRVEPTFKLKGTTLGMPERTYKDEQWYKEMTPRSKKIIDAAFKKKKEDEEEEE